MRLLALALALAVCATAATDPESKQKIKAIKDFARQGSSGMPSIAGYLQDQEVEVRREAVKSIVGIGGLASLDALVGACRDNDPEVQQRATDGLVNFYIPGYAGRGWGDSLRKAGSAVTSLFRDRNDQVVDPDTPVRPEVIQALIRLASGAASMDARANAVRALGILRGRAALPMIEEALKSKDDVLMYESLIAIQKIRDISAGPSAIFLIRDLDERIQLAAIETVGILRTKDAIPDLQRVLQDGGKKPRRAALAALGQIAEPSMRSTFNQYIDDRDEGIRGAAIEGLGRTGTSADQPGLERMYLSEKKVSLRLSEAFALVALGDLEPATDGPLRFLVTNLSSRSWRGVASPFLIELARRQPVRAAIYPLLQSLGDKDQLMGLCGVLAASGDPTSVPSLEALSRNPEPEVSREALRAVRMIQARN